MKMLRSARAVTCVLLIAGARLVWGQEEKRLPSWTVTSSWRVRMESWNWFKPPAGVAGDKSYTFLASHLRVGAAYKSNRSEGLIELANPYFVSLPKNSVSPPPQGHLGHGGTYRAVNGGQDGSVFLKQCFVSFKGNRTRWRLGRFEFGEGVESIPKEPNLAWLKRARIGERLIGSFGFSHVMRSFDGFNFAYDTPRYNFTFLATRPTQGAFDLDGMEEIDNVDLIYAGSTFKRFKTADARLFYLFYRDDRGVVKTDNRPDPVRRADREDIRIHTAGAHYLKTMKFGNGGKADFLMWGALQAGDWGLLEHEGNAFAVELGYQPPSKSLKPWIRIGYFRGSGDDDPNDRDHATFFQVLPTPRLYARFPFFNMMNNEDTFLQLILRPSAKVSIRADVHRLRLAEREDLWYVGGGAFQEESFGYATRPSNGFKSLATLIDLSLDYKVKDNLSLSLYLSHASGKDVVRRIYPAGDDASFIYWELNMKW